MLISSSALTVCPTCVPNTFVAPAGASTSGPIDMFSGVPVDFKSVSGTLGRNQGLGDPYVRGDISLRRTFRIPVHEGIMVQLRADLFNFANHTNFLLFNFSDVLSLLKPCGTSAGGIFTPTPGCTGGAGLDVTTGKYYGNNGQVLTLAALQHGRVSTIAPSGPNLTSLANPVFNGLGDPGIADINRQAQLSVKVTW